MSIGRSKLLVPLIHLVAGIGWVVVGRADADRFPVPLPSRVQSGA